MKTNQFLLTILFVILTSISVLCLPISGMQYPDYNNDQKTDLKDVIIALKSIAGFFNETVESVFSFNVMDTSGTNQLNVPVTVVYTFDKGQIQKNTTLIASLEQRKRSDETIIAQMTPIETYDDGSVSQAEITVMLPELSENEEKNIQILSTNQTIIASGISLTDVLQTDFDATIQLTQNNNQFDLNLRELLQNATVETLISGPIFSDFHVKGVLSGFENLSQNMVADVTIRMFKGFERCRIYTILENKLDQIQGSQNFIYDLKIQTGNSVFVRKNASFYPGIKTTKYMWWGSPVYVHISNNRIDEKLITSLQIETDVSDDKTAYPVTIGHVFKKGAVPSGFSIKGKLNDVSEIEIPMQVDVKANYDDGSLRHGVLSFFVPASTESQIFDILLFSYRKISFSSDLPVMLSDVMTSEFSSKVTVSMDDTLYQASLKDALSENTPDQWLKGPIASEWQVSSPLMSSDGNTHPHLSARFSIRAYKDLEIIRVSTTLENNWTYQENPHNLIYDADIYVNDQWIYGRDYLKHFHHARWRKVFYWQKSQETIVLFKEPVHVKHNIRYLIATKAIPNFNPDFIDNITENSIQEMVDKWEESTIFTDPDGNAYTLANNQPMGIGAVYAGTQSHDMWPLPYWTGRYLLSMDRRAKAITLGTADFAGSFPIHFRDRQTGLPVSINDYPYCSTFWKTSETYNPETKQYEAPLKCEGSNDDCWVPFAVNISKMPEFSYIPYIVTGDSYYLDELHFWANNAIIANQPIYRQYDRGLFSGEIISQAMSLGILGRTVFITPDDHPLKSYFSQILENNKDHIVEQYLETPQNTYGGLKNSSTLSSRGNDYYTFSLNSLVEMDFDAFKPILNWNAMYPVARMDSGKDFCWIFAAADLKASDTNSGQMYQTMAEVYQKNIEAGKIDDGGLACGSQALADYLKEKGKLSKGIAGEMIGYNDCVNCYIANMQPALAAAMDARIEGAEDAWERYMARPIKPDFIGRAYPNFDIVPRKMTFAKTDLPKGSMGMPYLFQFEVNSGEAPYYWELTDSGLPQEFHLDSSGHLSGIPAQAGEYTFSIQVTDAIQTIIQKNFVLKIIDPEKVPFLCMSNMNVIFPHQLMGEKSYPEHIDITNTGQEPLFIESITGSSVFPILHNCPSQLLKGDNCRISAFFQPTDEIKYTGLITIKSNAENGDQTIQLTGNGVTIPPEKELGIWVTSINFGAQPLTVKTMDSTVRLANNSQLPIEIHDIRISGNGFTMNNQCGEIISPRNQCSVNISFLPELPGFIEANLVIESNTDNSPHTIPLKGIGSNSLLESPICELILENLYDHQLVNQPITVGHSFIQGDIPAGKTVRFTIDNTDIPVQMEHKSTHADGSLKHGLLSFIVPEITAHSTKQVQLYVSGQTSDQQALKVSDLLATPYDAKLTIELDGKTYMASARQLLESTAHIKQWISGPICTEWLVISPLKDTSGNLHPHLTARFEIRAYAGMENIRSSITLENNWTYQNDPQNFNYHATITIGGEVSWDQPEQPHFHHARWRKVFWWNKQKGLDQASSIHVKHDVNYLIASKAIPNFDPQYINGISEYNLNDMETRWTQTKVYGPYSYCDRAYTMTVSDPMAIGFATHYMPMTGGRSDIGPIPRWTSRYLMSMDARTKKIELGHGNLSGSWSMHFRDKNTDLPVSIEDYPYCSTIWNKSNSINPNTKINERPTECEEGRDCKTPYTHDTSHHPSLAYVPYLISGDFYYLEELQFWANYCIISLNPHFRDFQKGLLKGNGQPRGQAWSLRTLGEAAYASPDDHPMKAYFMRQIDNNLDWYNETYTTNENANKQGWILPVHSFDDAAVISGWMDDFFTFAVGHMVELGFEKAKPLLAWKSMFPVGRMIDETFCWRFASSYRTVVGASREDANAGIYYQSFAEMYEPTLSWRESNTKDFYQEIIALECNSPEMTDLLIKHDILEYGVHGEMVSYTGDVEHGYQVILETALAYAVDSGIPGAREAWDRIINRAKRPEFDKKASYKWSIIPRNLDSNESAPEDYTKFVSIQNGKFHLEGHQWYPYGVNYWPHYSIHYPENEYSKPTSEYWLGSANYDASIIEQDLSVMESLGMNCISILGSLEQDTWDAMIDVLNRCQQHNIKVFLSFPYANPLKPEFYNIDAETALDDVITSLRLNEHPAIFAYDIAYEPYLCRREHRQRYDEKWSRFIQKEFWSIENAQNAFGRNIDIQRQGRSAGILSHNIPTRAIAGQSYTCHLKMKNMGTETWTQELVYRLGRIIGDDSFPGRVNIPKDVPPGDEVDLVFTYYAPVNTGRYRISFSMLQEWVAWFGPKVDWEIEVSASGSSVQKTIIYPTPILGPTDEELVSPAPDNLVNAFRRFGDTHTAIRFGQTIRKIKKLDPHHLISCRQGYGGNGNDWAIPWYPLELHSTAHHFDFLGPEAYDFMINIDSDNILSGMATIEAYCRWASNGKPVVWTEAAYYSKLDPDEIHLQEQSTFYNTFISHMLKTNSDGVLFWYWPGGSRIDEQSDYGITDENKNLRPAALTMQERAMEATTMRAISDAEVISYVNLFTSPGGFVGIYDQHRSSALSAYKSGKRYVMRGDGYGTTSAQAPEMIAGMTKHLWAEMGKIELKAGDSDWFEVRDGMAYAVPKNTPIMARAIIVNMGDSKWLTTKEGTHGAVYFAGNQNVGLFFKEPISKEVKRMEEAIIKPFIMTNGLTEDTTVQFQMLANEVAWMNGAVCIQLFQVSD
ncbi:conserved hypothetical protein, secreted [Candidatus Magnetomorum sp. HK-1]|nr:conserved hypothetical protein, secreted [Candidatus Magnetomorum sp. HK-1]